MKLAVLAGAILLTGCSAVQEYIPSFYDDNESHLAITVRFAVHELDCAQPHQPQVAKIDRALKYLDLYTESKGSRDVAKMIDPMQETVADFLKRGNEGSLVYCKLKKTQLEKQSAVIAETIMGRF